MKVNLTEREISFIAAAFSMAAGEGWYELDDYLDEYNEDPQDKRHTVDVSKAEAEAKAIMKKLGR